MPQPPLLEALRAAVEYENGWRVRASGEVTPYKMRLLSDHDHEWKAWWREYNVLPPGDWLVSEMVKSLRPAVAWLETCHNGKDVPSTALELKYLARAALRLGSWRLLHRVQRELLHRLRTWFPTPRRMSAVTGMTAEWALASLQPDIALIYGQESMVWGSEPHRTRAYLGYAHSCFGSRDRRNAIDIVLSRQATDLQVALTERRAYGVLHEIRIACISLLKEHGNRKFKLLRAAFERHIWQPVQKQPELSALLSQAVREQPTVFALLRCTAFVMQDLLGGELVPDSEVRRAIDELVALGRCRDVILLHQFDENRVPDLSPKHKRLIEELDGLAEGLAPLKFGSPDTIYLDRLPASVLRVASSPKKARMDARLAFLCCM